MKGRRAGICWNFCPFFLIMEGEIVGDGAGGGGGGRFFCPAPGCRRISTIMRRNRTV